MSNTRPAIAMIELIFALVIMGIVLMSAPMLISTASQSTSVALQQEGINEAASRVSMIMTYPWDEADTNDSCIPPVLHVTNGDDELDMNASSSRRTGVPLQTNSRTFVCGGRNDFNASVIGSEGGDLDDIDDFTNTSLVVDLSGSGGTDYIEQGTVSIATTISYQSDNADYNSSTVSYTPMAGAVTTNIKGIDVNLTSTSSVTELSKTIVLHAFSCNIGGREFAHKVIP
ncbi:MAG: type II secretion system protein [Sulfurovum sp.]|nr:type II secretion system protein [Sulfurovum sp.]